MSNFPVRGIAKGGVITDMDAYNLPIGSWSMGVNVRFRNGDITRSPVFRTYNSSLSYSDPRYVSAQFPSVGFDKVITGYLNGRVTSTVSGVETDLSITAYSNNSQETQFTSCHLGDVYYINRGDRIPWSLRNSDTIFQPLDNWDATWTANILRASNSALCAFGITKNGSYYPTMIKTSEFAIVDTVPTTWDDTLGTNNATENILGEMEGAITDACAFGDIMIVYGLNEAWTMVLDGSADIWGYHKLFSDRGAINANCVVEVDNEHYVFGLTDMWKHDGTTSVSICDGRTREFIFDNLNASETNRCFVQYNPRLKEVCFSYVSGDAYLGFPYVASGGCNRQAVYHIPTNTWSFDDLPYIFGAVMANLDTVLSWDSVTATWDNVGGTWNDQDDSKKKVCVAVGTSDATASLTASLYAFDLQGVGSAATLSVDTNATLGWSLYRDGIDLDEIGVDLVGYKLLNSIVPQGRLEAGATAITFTVGSADYFNAAVTWSDPQTWDGDTLYKLDFNTSGRYLFMKITQADYRYIKITGFDFDLDVLGER